MGGALLHWFGRSLTFHTTGKCPASRLVSRPYRNGYNALAVLVLVILPPLPSLDPLSGQAFGFELQAYSVFKVLFCFQYHRCTKDSIVIFDNLACIWLIPRAGADENENKNALYLWW